MCFSPAFAPDLNYLNLLIPLGRVRLIVNNKTNDAIAAKVINLSKFPTAASHVKKEVSTF